MRRRTSRRHASYPRGHKHSPSAVVPAGTNPSKRPFPNAPEQAAHMSGNLLADLSWLPRAPLDVATRCRALNRERENLGDRIRALASYALDDNQLGRLGKVIIQAQLDGRSLALLTSFRLGVIGNGTLDFVIPALVASAARHGVALQCIKGSYDQILQEAQSPASAIH